MSSLAGFEKKYLRGLAHSLKPVVFIGRQGMTGAIAHAVDEALDQHELIKVKFLDHKEKEQKETIRDAIEKETNARSAGIIGHMAIFYRQHHDPEKQRIILPKRRG
jgi:RNA-binding protein